MARHRLEYEITKRIERRIPKFNVRGTEMRMRVSQVPQDSTYDELWAMVHGLIERK